MNKWFMALSGLVLSTSVYGVTFDASLGYFPVARETGGIFQVESRVLSNCCKDWNPLSAYANWFAGVGVVGANRSNSFNTWVAGSLGFQLKTVQAIQWVDIRPEISWVYNGYTNSNGALALGAQFLAPNPTSPLAGASLRWSLNGDVLLGVVFKPQGYHESSCDNKTASSCSKSASSCHPKHPVSPEVAAVEEPRSDSPAVTDQSPSTPFAYRTLSVKVDSPKFRDLKGRKSQSAIIRLARVGFFADDTRFAPTKALALKDYNAVVKRLHGYLGLTEFVPATNVPSPSDFQAYLNNLLSGYVAGYPDSSQITNSFSGIAVVKGRDLSREQFATAIFDYLAAVPNLLP